MREKKRQEVGAGELEIRMESQQRKTQFRDNHKYWCGGERAISPFFHISLGNLPRLSD